jgi:CRP-like cAMP-binding protein
LSDQILKRIAVLAEDKTIPAGERLFNEGDPAKYLYVIAKGEVNIQYLLGDGQLRTVDTLVDGDLLVWSALIEPYTTTAIGTATRETQLVGIAADKLRQLCEEDPLLGYRLTTEVAKLLAHRLEGARVQLAAHD